MTGRRLQGAAQPTVVHDRQDPVAVNLAWILEEIETKEKVDEYTFDECLSVTIAACTYDDLWLQPGW